MSLGAWAQTGCPLMYLLLSACSITRTVPVVLDAPGLSTFLTDHPHTNLRVTEHSGRRYWVHAPVIRGDSLVGQRGYDVRVQPLGVPLEQVAALHSSHFSWGRTGAVVAGTLATAAAALAILIKQSEPTY
jgi:hypothetical protein